MKKAIIILGIAGAATGIYLYYKKQVSLLMDFTYDIIGYGVEKVGMAESIIKLTIRVHSASKLSATVSDMNLDVYMEGVKLGNVKEVKPIVIPAMGYSDVELKVAFSPLQIGQNAVDLVRNYTSKMDAQIRVAGYMKVKAAFINTSVPFEYTTTVKEQLAS
jgi:LEA14-like dessication related protein